MKIGIISDTHDQIGRVKKAVEIFNKEKVGLVIHCGDYDCVFSGHDHIARMEKRGKVLFVNPGTLTDKHKEGMKTPSIAIYDSAIHDAKIINLV